MVMYMNMQCKFSPPNKSITPSDLVILYMCILEATMYTVEPLHKDTPEMRTSRLIRTPCTVPLI